MTTTGFGRKNLTTKNPSSGKASAPLPDELLSEIAEAPAASNTNALSQVAVLEPDYAPENDPRVSHLEACYADIWTVLRKDVDIKRFARLSKREVAEETRAIVGEISRLREFKLTDAEIGQLCTKLLDELLGLGPIEPLLARDEVTEIMVNGPRNVYIEINGVVERAAITFRDAGQLHAICQRIAAQVGRRVDESSPICDARLIDGSRVNIILPPLALEGPTLTIRKFQKEKPTLEKLEKFGSLDRIMAELIRMIAACHVNVLISGGTGTGKTTMLNCLTRHISPRERIVTCEDAAELQLQQPHVVRLETRPANLEGAGEVAMRDLVRNCLRMRPDRIVVGEVRGAEAFDLLQAMNTGHDGSLGTIHANTPRDALNRLESMIAMTRLNIPTLTVRQQIASAINVIIQIQRFHDGSRRVVSISEVTGMEGEVITMQDLAVFEVRGESAEGRVLGTFKTTGLRPRFYDKLKTYGLEERFVRLMESAAKQA